MKDLIISYLPKDTAIAIMVAEEINKKLEEGDDRFMPMIVEIMGQGRYAVKFGYISLFDSADNNWDPEEETLEQYLWDELADLLDDWMRISDVINKNKTA